MKENIYAIILFVIEAFFFYVISVLLHIPFYLTCRIGLIWFATLFIFKHFKIQSTLVWDEIRSNLKAFIYYVLLSVISMYPHIQYLLEIVCVGFFMFIVSVFVNRSLRIILRSKLARKTLVIGTGDLAYRIGKISHNNRFALTNVVGFVKMCDEPMAEELVTDNRFQIYDHYQLDDILKSQHIDQAIIAIPDATQQQIDEVTKKLFDRVKIIKIAPNLNFTMTFNSKINDYDGVLLISTSRGKLGTIERIAKRIVDICAGIAGCLLVIPLYFYVRHKNKQCGDNDPVFFKQERIGLHGKPIYIYKFRSMIPHAEEVLEELMANNPDIREEYLTNKKLVDDPRITKVGHFLRKTSLDEFPQFFNVLKGDMSLVGPRPYLPREKEDMDIYYKSVIACKPGITGMWQANGRSDVGFMDRCKLDDYYYRNWSLGLDLIIIYKTVKSVIYGKGAL